ncbi:teichoic acid ABC transporter permease [Paenibacillus stellifer]|uniref:Transport permease protein n=1 Tax=Paenibacillus stellifer TaxID=169760 RepID=A0A089LY04_9BACL|nr:ABC transporter permease [Paenibacillus stellifer]AIQ65802.1 teichoic acid ABC transporter permease [Paenibacillus stellifer]
MSSIKDLWNNKGILYNMSKSDFKSRFSGSYFGVFWAIIQPLMTILIFWFVFQVGFRAQPISNAPFILWLCAAMIPWNFFSDAIINSTGAFTSYSFVVKKLVFKVSLLPLVKIIASFFLNLAFNLLLIIIFSIYGYFPGIHLIDILYYNICIFMLVTVVAYFISTLNVFFRDTSQIIGILLQFGIWLTPIMWEESVIPEKYRWFIKLNPIYYIVNGYREALINHNWFFAHPRQTFYFWFVVIVIGWIGISFFKKMKPHFADVL